MILLQKYSPQHTHQNDDCICRHVTRQQLGFLLKWKYFRMWRSHVPCLFMWHNKVERQKEYWKWLMNVDVLRELNTGCNHLLFATVVLYIQFIVSLCVINLLIEYYVYNIQMLHSTFIHLFITFPSRLLWLKTSFQIFPFYIKTFLLSFNKKKHLEYI